MGAQELDEQIVAILGAIPPCAGIRETLERLVALGDRAEVLARVQHLCADHPDPRLRYHAQRVLLTLPSAKTLPPLRTPVDREVLREALAHEDPGRRLQGLGALGQITKAEAAELVLEAIRRPETDSWVLSYLASALGHIGGEGATEEAAELLEHASPRVAANALVSLFRLEPTTARYAARWRLQAEDNRLRANAVLVLYGASPDIAWAQVEEMARSPDEWMRASACYLANQVPHKESTSLLLEMAAKEESAEILARAVTWLGKAGDPLASGALHHLSQSEEELVRSHAIKGLEALRARGSVDEATLEAESREFARRRNSTLAAAAAARAAAEDDELPEPAPAPAYKFDFQDVFTSASLPAVQDPVEDALARLEEGDTSGAVARLVDLLPSDPEEQVGFSSRFRWALARAYCAEGEPGLALRQAQELDPEELQVEEVYQLANALTAGGLYDSACGAYHYLESREPGYRNVPERVESLMEAHPPVPEDLLVYFSERYRDVAPLGEGGMGRVFEAVERGTGRAVALKVPDERTLEDPRMRERFLKEMQALAGVSHPHVIPLLRVHLGELPYYAMEKIEGESYRDRIDQRAPLAPADCLPVMRGLASALAFLHGLGIVHQDVKPDNLLIDGQGVARLSDFGLAVEIGRNFDAHDEAGAGSPVYMAPEQFSAAAAQPSADVFAFGVILFESLAGARPYPDDQPLAKLTQAPRSLAEVSPNTPVTLVKLAADCLAKDASQRPANGTELLQRLDELPT